MVTYYTFAKTLFDEADISTCSTRFMYNYLVKSMRVNVYDSNVFPRVTVLSRYAIINRNNLF